MKNHIFFYRSEAGRVHPPRRIPAGSSEIELFIDGRGKTRMADGAWLPLFPGVMLTYRAGESIEAEADAQSPYAVYGLQFDPAEIGFPVETLPRRCVWRNPSDCESFCLRIAEAQQAGAADSDYWRCLLTRCRWESLDAALAERRSALHPALQRVLPYLRKNFRRPLPVRELLRIGGIGEAQLHALFRAHCHTTPARMIAGLRLDYARNLLLLTGRPVKEIAAESGYPDCSNFIAAFRRAAGMTPAEFRRRACGA